MRNLEEGLSTMEVEIEAVPHGSGMRHPGLTMRVANCSAIDARLAESLNNTQQAAPWHCCREIARRLAA